MGVCGLKLSWFPGGWEVYGGKGWGRCRGEKGQDLGYGYKRAGRSGSYVTRVSRAPKGGQEPRERGRNGLR